MIDVANCLVQFSANIDYTCEKILRPLYEEMYENSEKPAEKVASHVRQAQRALIKAGAIIELFRSANNRLPLLQLENQRYNDEHVKTKASRHVTIALSGFLSQSDRMKEGWEQLH